MAVELVGQSESQLAAADEVDPLGDLHGVSPGPVGKRNAIPA